MIMVSINDLYLLIYEIHYDSSICLKQTQEMRLYYYYVKVLFSSEVLVCRYKARIDILSYLVQLKHESILEMVNTKVLAYHAAIAKNLVNVITNLTYLTTPIHKCDLHFSQNTRTKGNPS